MVQRPLSQVQPGMRLASDLTDADGRVLLPRGVVLDEQNLKILARRGVTAADVVEDEPAAAADAGVPAKVEELARRYTLHFFAFTDLSHPAVQAMGAWCAETLARRIADGLRPRPLSDLGQPGENPPYDDLFLKDEGAPEDLLAKGANLPSFPDVAVQILEVVKSPASSTDKVAEVVSRDPGLAAKLLRLANSPVYGFSSKVDTVSRAVAMIGTRELITLASGVAAMEVFKDVPPELVDVRGFWRQSVACGSLAKILAKAARHGQTERFFVAGMLHSIGRLVILQNLPHAASQAYLYSLANQVPLHVAETEVMGFDHARVAGLLMDQWQFPAALSAMIRCQHAPETAPEPADAALLHLAVAGAAVMEVAGGRKMVAPELSAAAWGLCGLEPDALADWLTEADGQVEQILDIFQGSQ